MTIQQRIRILQAREQSRIDAGNGSTALEVLQELLDEVGEHVHVFGEPKKVYISRGGMGASIEVRECECGIRKEVK